MALRTSIDELEDIRVFRRRAGRQDVLETHQQARGGVVLLVEIDPARGLAGLRELLRPLRHQRGLAVAGGGLNQRQLGGTRLLEQTQETLAPDGVAPNDRGSELAREQHACEPLIAERLHRARIFGSLRCLVRHRAGLIASFARRLFSAWSRSS
jgi:hypothetical protein